jgi:hypothetical protein
MLRGTGSKKEALCQEEMEQVRQEKARAEVLDRDGGEWVEVPAWGPAGIVSALNAGIRVPIPGECLAIP